MIRARDIQTLYRDDDFLAVDKPAGLIVIPGRDESASLIELLRKELGEALLLVHRIDKDTSGVLLLARNSAAQRFASRQFQTGQVAKQYLALVTGKPTAAAGQILAPIGQPSKNSRRMAVLKHGGRPAETHWQIEQSFRHHTLLRVFPKTGKTHQIRVHLAHIGLPLVIDELYNSRSQTLMLSSFKRGYRPGSGDEKPLINRLTLHAERLTFTNLSNQRTDLQSPLPKDLRATLNMLTKYSAA